MDKVESIVAAVADAIETNVDAQYNVFQNRGVSLDYAGHELPAINVDFGEDSPVTESGQDTLDGEVESVLTVTITCVAADLVEKELRSKLLAMRQAVAEAVRVDNTQGLTFVLDTHYGGAEAPAIADEGETLVGGLVCVWGIMYQFNVDAP